MRFVVVCAPGTRFRVRMATISPRDDPRAAAIRLPFIHQLGARLEPVSITMVETS